jgi:hypothetical protein
MLNYDIGHSLYGSMVFFTHVGNLTSKPGVLSIKKGDFSLQRPGVLSMNQTVMLCW